MTGFMRRASILVLCLSLGAGSALAAGNDKPTKEQDSSYTQAVKLIKARDFNGALPLLEKSIAADRTNANAYNYLGFSHRMLGDKEAAIGFYLKALDINAEHRGANEYLGELYLEMGKLDQARERLKVLDKACFFGCDEHRELKAKIAAYQAKTGS